MKTLLLTPEQLDIAAEILKEGKIVAFPTETVFGMGVIYNDYAAIEHLKDVKGRAEHKPFTLMVQNKDEISKFAQVSKEAWQIIDEFMPGPLTIILPVKENLIGPFTNESDFVGIRISSEEMVQILIKQVGAPLLVPSANKSNTPPLFKSEDVLKQFNGEIAAIITGNALGSVASTIIKINDKLTLVREGAIPFDLLEKKYLEAKHESSNR